MEIFKLLDKEIDTLEKEIAQRKNDLEERLNGLSVFYTLKNIQPIENQKEKAMVEKDAYKKFLLDHEKEIMQYIADLLFKKTGKEFEYISEELHYPIIKLIPSDFPVVSGFEDDNLYDEEWIFKLDSYKAFIDKAFVTNITDEIMMVNMNAERYSRINDKITPAEYFTKFDVLEYSFRYKKSLFSFAYIRETNVSGAYRCLSNIFSYNPSSLIVAVIDNTIDSNNLNREEVEGFIQKGFKEERKQMINCD